MSFWGVEVKPNEPFTLESYDLGGPLMLTQATLGVGSSLEKSVLQVNVGDKKPIFVCSLLPEISECFTLNLEFDEEEDVTFSVVGPTSIHLSGYVRGSNMDDDDEPDFDGLGEDMDEMTLEDNEVESEDDHEDDSNHDDDRLTHPSSSSHNEGVVVEEMDDEENPVGEKGGSKQVEKKKKKKKESLTVESDRKLQQQANVENIKVRTYPNGLIVEEVETGKPNGRIASHGKKVSVHYIGKLLKNGKIFDSNTGKKPFKFRLGAGQVIKGWDVGVEGMRVGDKRRLTIPPAMGYSSDGAGPIPPNAWLIFEVKLVDVA